MRRILRNLAIAVIAATIPLTALPVTSARAAGQGDPPGPPWPGRFAEFKLELAWRRELRAYELIGRVLDRADTLIERANGRLEELASEGKDVTELQAALDAFEDAIGDVHPIYQGLNGLVESHRGFDAVGRVTDIKVARETVKSMHQALAEIKETMAGTWRGLLEALRTFREANAQADGTSF